MSTIPATSDVLMVLLRRRRLAESPDFDHGCERTHRWKNSTVGFTSNDWVLVGPKGGLGPCMITHVDTSFVGATVDNVVLPLKDASVGSAAGMIAANNFVMNLGKDKATANFHDVRSRQQGPCGRPTSRMRSMSLDLLNSTLSRSGMKVTGRRSSSCASIYGVDPTIRAVRWTKMGESVVVGNYRRHP